MAKKKAGEEPEITILDLIENKLETMGVVEFAESIGINYRALWAIRKGMRKLPLEPTISLTQQYGITGDKALLMFLKQKITNKHEKEWYVEYKQKKEEEKAQLKAERAAIAAAKKAEEGKKSD